MFDYYEIPNVRKICHQAKQGDPEALEIIAQSLAVHVRPEDVVTPVPGRTGEPGVMLAVCKRVADIAGCTVWDGIRGADRPSQYAAKKTQGGLTEEALGFYLQATPPQLTGHGKHRIIDTIQDTGLTLNAALRLLPGAEPHPYATVDKAAEQRAHAVFAQCLPKGDVALVEAVSALQDEREAFSYAYRALQYQPDLEAALSEAITRQFPVLSHAGLREGVDNGFVKAFSLAGPPPIANTQRHYVQSIAAALSEVIFHHEAGFHFEEGGCWGFSRALHDHLAQAGIPSTIQYSDGDFTHCYVNVGGALFDHQGEVVAPDDTLHYVSSAALPQLASRNGVTKDVFLSDVNWAAEILEDAKDVCRVRQTEAVAEPAVSRRR